MALVVLQVIFQTLLSKTLPSETLCIKNMSFPSYEKHMKWNFWKDTNKHRPDNMNVMQIGGTFLFFLFHLFLCILNYNPHIHIFLNMKSLWCSWMRMNIICIFKMLWDVHCAWSWAKTFCGGEHKNSIFWYFCSSLEIFFPIFLVSSSTNL